MLKRTTAIIFIILANMLVLAHAVVPHHHHHKQVCFINSHCINDNIADEQNTNRDNHSHDGEKNSDDCILKAPVIVSTNQWKIDFKFNDKTSDQSGHFEFYNCQSNTRTEFVFPLFSRFAGSYFNNSSYSSLVSASLGLRAPPVV
jgi:hypothetical protein